MPTFKFQVGGLSTAETFEERCNFRRVRRKLVVLARQVVAQATPRLVRNGGNAQNTNTNTNANTNKNTNTKKTGAG